ncbi:MAG: hypothetical protein II135_05670, partial [Clostridia bacterium]|nr:hypothetical protein [Clostridia bacterium]
MKKITAVITALFILIAAASCDAAVTPVPGSTAPAETGSVTKPADTEKATEAQTEAATEKATEAQTEAPTEKVTEAPTEPVTETPTEPVTEQDTAYPPDEYDSVLV